MKDVLESIKKKLKNKKNVSEFIIYDNFSKKFIYKPFINDDVKIIPICLRQEYFSHMVIVLIKINNEKNIIHYYDPSGDKCPDDLSNFLKEKFRNFLFYEEKLFKNHQKKKFDCVNFCMLFINRNIQNGFVY